MGVGEVVKWIMGILAAILLLSIKYSVDSASNESSELKEKVDKVYDYTTNHEVRVMIIEKEVQEHRQKILDLQLAQERWGDLSYPKAPPQVGGGSR
jgi:hypothetical protein